MSVDAGPRKVDAEYAIEYLQEHPEAGFAARIGAAGLRRTQTTPNARILLLDVAEADRLKDDPRLRLVSGIGHAGRSLRVVRRMT